MHDELFISAESCPFCGNLFIKLISRHGFHYVTCDEDSGGCGAVTKLCLSMEMAIECWNRRNEGLMRGNGNRD